MSAGDWKQLFQAVVDGDLARVQYYIREGVDLNYQHPEILCTPLVASLIHGHGEITHCLLAHGADPHLVAELGELSPLQVAKAHGRDEFVTLLRGLGAKESRKPFWWRWLPV